MIEVDQSELRAFVKESNRIEGITRAPTMREVEAHRALLNGPMSVERLMEFVAVIAPWKPLRDRPGLNVYVGGHRPPPGGLDIRTQLAIICGDADHRADPYLTHIAYETLHPFMDGNGRSGRALWLWMMLRQDHGDPYALRRGFLHTFYYQTLDASR